MTPINNKKALVFLNGVKPSKKLISVFWNENTFIVAADGSYHYLKKYKLIPHMIIGDMDSVNINTLQKDFQGIIKQIKTQETTDGEKSLAWLISQKYQIVNVLGAMGKNTDHSLYNLGLLKKYAFLFKSLIFWTEKEQIFLISRNCTLQGEIGERISFFPLFGKVYQISTKNFKYNLNKQDLLFGNLSSISNEFVAPYAEITFQEGFLCVIKEHSKKDQIKEINK